MKVSEQWLREWVNPPLDTTALAEQLTMAGLEVDAVAPVAPPLDGVVVGAVLSKIKHPNADRLSLCSVDIGAAEPLSIVCGASNVAAGGRYPVATVGTRLPGGLKIKRSKVRGEVSSGMLCSAVELGIADAAEGLLELPADAPAGQSVVELLQLDDQVIDVDLTPNRADCFSMLGLARDLAAVNGLDFAEPDIARVETASQATLPAVLEAPDACPVFATRVLTGINPRAATPLWLVERLRRAGVRPLRPAVDVTNYVMLELGQPLHAYDQSKLSGALRARWARAGEQLELLGGATQELSADVLVIADEKGPVALAGIMGGEASAVSAATTDIVLESAFFAPAAVAGRARRFGLHTDAALRFERGVDFAQQARALERATDLLISIAGGSAGPVCITADEQHLPERATVELRRRRLAEVLGVELDDAAVTALLCRLGFAVEATADGWSVRAQPARFDIAIEADLIEEVARLYGYDQIPTAPQTAATPLAAATESRVPVEQGLRLLAARGYQEIISYSFVSAEQQATLLGAASETRLANPLATDMAVMRRSLLPGLISTLDSNRKRQQERVYLFELGVTFVPQGNEVIEKTCLAGLAWGAAAPEHWDAAGQPRRPTDLFDIKTDLDVLLGLGGLGPVTYVRAEHPALRPGRTARLERAGQVLGWLGELHPRSARQMGLAAAPVLFELDVAAAFAAAPVEFAPVSRFPAVRRDLAVIVAEEVEAGVLVETAHTTLRELLTEVIIFDVYRGDSIEKGLKSIALGLILQETSSTLTEAEIDAAVARVMQAFTDQYNASIRE